MIPYKAMHDYVKQAISKYEEDKKSYSAAFQQFNEFDSDYFPEQILLDYGWRLVIAKPYRHK